MTERRVSVTFRVAPKGRAMVEDLLHEPGLEGADMSDVFRAALALAFRHRAELVTTIKEKL